MLFESVEDSLHETRPGEPLNGLRSLSAYSAAFLGVLAVFFTVLLLMFRRSKELKKLTRA